MRHFKVYSFLVFIFFGGLGGCEASYQGPLQEGDIVFQDLPCSQSEAIKLATHSPYSHVGIVFYKSGNPYIYEGVGPVKFTPLKDWIAQGEGSHYSAKRLKNADKVLTPFVLQKMKETAKEFKGKAYDWFFEWSDNKIYCSELVWKIYQRSTGLELGRLQKVKDLDLSDPRVKKEMKERFGNQVPLNLKLISPEGMFQCEMLTLVVSN